jgi:hypothetical protein
VTNFFTPKTTESRGEVLLDLYYPENCFWSKAAMALEPFSWLLAFS